MAVVRPDYKPLPAFEDFHRSPAFERCLFGGMGSGKSVALCAEALAIGLEQPGSEILIARKAVTSLRDTTEKTFIKLFPTELWDLCKVSKLGGHHAEIVLPNGTIFYLKGMDDWTKHKSMNLAYVVFDEVDELDIDIYSGMMTRLRQTKPTQMAREQGAPDITRRGVIAACNPRGHNWVWNRFVNTGNKGYAKDGEHWVSSSLDNPYTPVEYIEHMLTYPDHWVRRNVLGSFDEFGGAVYEDWTFDSHVIRPLEPGGDDPFVMGFDPGTSAGNAAVWCRYQRDKHRLVAVAEYDEKGLAADRHAAEWRRIEARHRMRVRTRVADPKAITVRDRGTNMGLDAQYRRLGFNFQPGTNHVETRVHSLGQLIAARRFVVTTDCMRLFEQIQNYRWEDLTSTQMEAGRVAKPIKKDVDLVDAAQYIACRYIAPPKLRAGVKGQDPEAVAIAEAIRRQLRDRRSAPTDHDFGTIGV